MEIDLAFIKDILLIMKDNTSHRITNLNLAKELKIDLKDDVKIDLFVGYIKFLGDLGSLECDSSTEANFGFRETHPSSFVISPVNYRLTAKGYSLLEAMQDETLWSKISSGIKNVTKDTVKQIPSLAIQLLLTSCLGTNTN